jgi:transposase-like protein
MKSRFLNGRRRGGSIDHLKDRLICKNCGATYTEEAVEDRQEGW